MARQPQIAVGVDGSSASLHALDWAAQEAAARHLGLLLVCAYSVPSLYAAALDGGFAALDDSTIRQGTEQVLADAASRAAGAGVPVETSLLVGDAAGQLVDVSHRVRMVVVGTRGRGGFAGRLLGTVSSALPAHASCPTVVVPLRPGAEDAEPGAPIPRNRVVVGVDGSPQAELALRYAIEVAELWHAELVAVAGVPVAQMSGALAWLPAALDPEQVLHDYESTIAELLDRAVADRPALSVRRVVLDGTGAELLTEFSAATDLVVVGSRGRGGFAGLLLGSTSQAVLHHSKAPVMVVTGHCDDLSPTSDPAGPSTGTEHPAD